MFYDKELDFICNVLQKSHIGAVVAQKQELPSMLKNLGFEDSAAPLQPNTVYKLSDALGLSYLYLLLPSSPPQSVLLIGPYLPDEIDIEHLPELGERVGVSPKHLQYLEEYMSGLTVMSHGDHLHTMLEYFYELIWQNVPFTIIDVHSHPENPVSRIEIRDDDLDGAAVNMKAMEARYAFENELIRAVTLGQLHMERQLLSAFSDASFESRTPDSLRNAKNYGIIMNTLLRKAAESGGVHPMYIDRMSSEFAVKIEQMPSLSETTSLMSEMFRAYCRLVRKHSTKKFSPMIQKAILYIDAALSSELSASILADQLGVSLGYLSAAFKKETGQTLSEYVRVKRVEHAKHLLSTTKLQIQTVALHCGIMDVQYFSKIFKKETGVTPKEYRNTIK